MTGEPIAIVGMAGRFPGADSVARLWELLAAGIDAVGSVPPDRWDAAAPLDPAVRVPAAGGFLDDVAGFDAALFGISPREAADIDPQQRVFLETVWRALEDARTPADLLRGARIGVYAGASWHDYETLRLRSGASYGPHGLVGSAVDVIAARVSYVLGLTGPSMTVQTGCSSALVALDLAVAALRSGAVDAALAGGVNLMLSPEVTVGLTHFGALSPEGRCAAFGAGADGFVRGEGVGVVYLKTLSAARRDRDPVRAVIHETVVNNDGGGDSLVTPRLEGQRDLLRRAYRDLDPRRVAYVEAHGTGTGRGDPVEASALGDVLGHRAGAPLLVGSVKTGIGHLEAAAGVAGLIKAVLCLEHRRVPASLHAELLNPDIDFAGLGLRVVRTPTPLPAGPEVLVGVNSFGWGGTNAHVVLGPGEAPAPADGARAESGSPVLAVSAQSPAALRQRCAAVAEMLATGGDVGEMCAASVAYAPALPWRAAVLGADPAAAIAGLRAVADGVEGTPGVLSGRARAVGKVAFVFPGQGSQWHTPAAGLYGRDPAFTAAVDDCAAALAPHVSWDTRAVLTGAAGPGWLERVDQVQPVLWAYSLGIAAMWRRMGVVPDVVIGHSQGEIGAAVVAGLLDPSDAALVVARRGAALRAVAGTGRMLAVDLSADEIPAAIAGFEDAVTLAVHNGPRSCVLSGDVDAIDALAEILTAEGIYCRPVNVDYASHSPRMARLVPALRADLAAVTARPGTVAMLSTVTAQPLTDAGPDYWVENLCRPVRFAEAMSALFDAGVTHVLEMSPHPVLTPAIEHLAALRPDPPIALGTLTRDRDPVAELAVSRARAFVHGLRPFADLPGPGRNPLPATTFHRERYWLAAPAPATDDRIVLRPTALEPGARHAWAEIGPHDLGWLADHRVGEAVIAPATYFLALATIAGDTVVRDIRFVDALPLDPENPAPPTRVEILLRPGLAGTTVLEIRSTPPGSDVSTLHARADLVPAGSRCPETGPPPSTESPDATTELDVAEFYRRCARRGLHYGPEFRGIRELRTGTTAAGRTAHARIELGQRCRARIRAGELHPALLDAAAQTALVLFDQPTDSTPATVVPVALAEYRILHRPDGFVDRVWAHARQRGPLLADIEIRDDDGRVLAALNGLALAELDTAGADLRDHRREFRMEFTPEPEPVCAPGAECAPRAADTGHPARSERAVFVLVDPCAETGAAPGDPNTQCAHLAAALTDRGAVVTGELPADHPATVVFLAPTVAAGLDAQRAALPLLADLARRCLAADAAHRVVVVTTDAQAAGPERPDPGAALFWGFGRVLRREHPELDTVLLDLAGGDATATRWASCAAELCAPAEADQILLRAGVRLLGRLRQGAVQAAPPPRRSARRPFRLAIGRGRRTDDVHFRPLTPRAPGPGEVLVRVEAAAINFIDLMKATGAYPDGSAGADLLGVDCAGVITAIGHGVTGRTVGQRVVACAFGALASHLTVRADHIAPVPAALTTTTAAALPLVLTTAWYALARVARVEPGETVLIHSAAGGVGAAAVAVAHHLGARVLATAGSAQRREHLRAQGIEHVFDSRGAEWPAAVRAVTAGRGVDVVLNALAGAAVEHGLAVLAEDGRFVEIGKRDIYTDRRIGLRPFAHGITVAAVDLGGMMTRRPRRYAEVLREAWRLVDSGVIAALPTTVHDFAAATAALAALADDERIGKIVLARPATVRDIAPEPLPDGRFRADGTYLITGGHGALGRSLADHLLAHGAGSVALLGRGTYPVPDDPRLRSYRADVGDRAALADTLAAIRAAAPPLRGVFHAAGVLDDATVLGLSADRIEPVLRPKVDGARHLHELTADDPLDLFVLFSSAAALVGNPGQAVYAAANAYLDALAVARRHDGRPGLSVQWGPFDDIGLAAARAERGARLADRGLTGITAADAWTALHTFLDTDACLGGYLGFDRRRWFDAYPECAGQHSWTLLAESTEAPAVPGEWTAAPSRGEPVRDTVTALAARVLRVSPTDLDPTAPLRALGLDSLLALELRNHLENAFALRLSATLLWTYGTVAALAQAIEDRLAAHPA